MGLYSECMTLAQAGRGGAREHVAEEVRALMGRHRVSANRLAVMTGLTQSSMSRRLSGRYPFTVDELEVIAEAFGVPITALFGGGDRPGGLPRLDSNQQPSGSLSPQVTGTVVALPTGRDPRRRRLTKPSPRPVSTLPGCAA